MKSKTTERKKLRASTKKKIGILSVLFVLFILMCLFYDKLPNQQKGWIVPICYNVILAVSLNVTVGILGELSLGHAGFMCVGAFAGAFVVKLFSIIAPEVSFWWVYLIAFTAAAVLAALFGLLIGIPVLRLKGDYLAIVTLAFGEIVKSLFQNSSSSSFGGAIGLSTPRFDKNTLFIYGFLLVLATLAVIQNLMRSNHGRAITAIRDNEIAARATGINVTKYKLMAFTISAFFAGIAGVLYSFSNYNVESAKFGYNYSIEILVMVVLGGMGSINGSIIAATLITFLNAKLATVLTGDLAVLQNLFYALILIIIVIYNNAPALKGFRERYNFRSLFARFGSGKHDPAKVADDRADWDKVPTKIKMDELLSIDPAKVDPYKPDEPKKGDK